ncbi:MAG: choice-of-anchor I family protein [Solirubrobacterales bacterium]|nr:choice-of-anchor I family protein [Solirubrobacterales bacterium]
MRSQEQLIQRQKYVLAVIFTAIAVVLIPMTSVSWAAEPVELDPVGRTAAMGEGGVEIAAYDPAGERAFATNAAANAVDVYDFSDPAAPVKTGSVPLSVFGGGPNSVDYATSGGGLLAVAVEAFDKTDPGTVELFDGELRRVGSIRVGALPDMLTFTRGGEQLLVANEGEPADDGSVDPQGSVTLIDLSRGVDDAVVRTARLGSTPLRGPVRVFGPGTSQAQDLEPEYITTDGERAWVSIQEANAVGILDIDAARFTVVRSLGFKDHGVTRNGLDPDDRDAAAEIAARPNVMGMYQPDAIAHYAIGAERRDGRPSPSRTYVITANEGDSRDYEYFSEESRVEDLSLDPVAFGAQAAADLARLTVTTTMGDRDGDGDYDRLFAFGGRSISILDEDAGLDFDTGAALERRAEQLDAANFNKDNEAGSEVDNRSDNKGPEPEALDVGRLGGRPYAFVGAERSGGIYAFDLAERPGRAVFAGHLNTREDDLGPEGLRFIPARRSPTSEPALMLASEISGTISLIGVSRR